MAGGQRENTSTTSRAAADSSSHPSPLTGNTYWLNEFGDDIEKSCMIDGGGGGFDELLPYYKAVVSFIIGLGFSPDDARDLTQEVFIRVYRNMDAWRADSRWG